VLATLAERSRITSRAVDNDPNIAMHHPGVLLRLSGSEESPEGEKRPLLSWSVPDFAALLLRRSVTVASLISDPAERARTLDLADEVWDHVNRRRLRKGDDFGLWDDPSQVFFALKSPSGGASWCYTERVVEGLVEVAQVIDQPPTRDEGLASNAVSLLREAEQIFDREVVNGGLESGPALRDTLRLVDVTLRRAREILAERPGTAAALICDSLRQLDRLEAARRNISTEA